MSKRKIEKKKNNPGRNNRALAPLSAWALISLSVSANTGIFNTHNTCWLNTSIQRCYTPLGFKDNSLTPIWCNHDWSKEHSMILECVFLNPVVWRYIPPTTVPAPALTHLTSIDWKVDKMTVPRMEVIGLFLSSIPANMSSEPRQCAYVWIFTGADVNTWARISFAFGWSQSL